jgi:hypothetical protein
MYFVEYYLTLEKEIRKNILKYDLEQNNFLVIRTLC